MIVIEVLHNKCVYKFMSNVEDYKGKQIRKQIEKVCKDYHFMQSSHCVSKMGIEWQGYKNAILYDRNKLPLMLDRGILSH